MNTYIVDPNTSLIEHARPILMKLLKEYGLYAFINAMNAIETIEDNKLRRPNIVYYDEKESLFGWKTVALHMFHDGQIYVQTLSNSDNELVKYDTITFAIEACNLL